jgi:hypothetical protein
VNLLVSHGVGVPAAVKFAVNVLFSFINIVTLALVDVDAPDHPVKSYPFIGVAVTVTAAPDS